jgi:hypothetical protein
MRVKMRPNAYGFGMDWWLCINNKEYWLGQDVKVCSRLLGCRPHDLITELSQRTGLDYETCREIQNNEDVNVALANLLIEAYNMPEDSEPLAWELAVE